MPLSQKKCCVPGCLESGGSDQTLHLFPNPEKDKERFKQWVMSIGGDILGLKNEDIYKYHRVCHVHFDEKYCCHYKRLSNIAVPTLHLPGPLSLPRFTYDERRPMKKIENISSLASLPSTSCTEFPALYKHKKQYTEVTMKENIDPLMEEPTTSITALPVSKLEVSREKLQDIEATVKINIDPVVEEPVTPIVTKIVRKPTRVTHEENKLYKKLVQTRIKPSKSRNMVKTQAVSLKAAKKITTNPILLKTLEKFSSAAKVLTMMQFREVKKKNKGRRFSLQEKILALSIFKQAPKSYRFLRRILILPAPQTLAKLISQANIKPGINENIFSQLKTAGEKMKEEERLCVLIFDEMSLKANISYNERKDKVVGFVTDGEITKAEFADHAQVFMIRGLIKNYKQPVSYTFSAAATNGQQIAKQIKEIVMKLQEAGLIVVATVCDQGSNIRNAIKLLLQETRGLFLKKGEEPKENVVLINNHEVIPLYDPPHLIKCVRNNLLTKNLQYISNGTQRTAKWEHLILLHKENPGYKGVRLIPKLSDDHVVPEKLSRKKMKVKYATQIFSRTIATNMGYLADKGILPKECSETADILLFFDNLFDSQNGSYNKNNQKFAKSLLGPITPNSAHHKQWLEAKKQLKTMKFINPVTGKAENVPTLQNWAWTLDGLEVLTKKLEKEFNINSIWARHLNQDPLENFFGAIRSHGARNTNPTSENFENAFASLLINNMSSVHAPGANCEDDLAKNLHALIVTEECKATSTTCDINYVPQIEIEDISLKTDPRVLAPLQYISGYFIKNSKKKVFKGCKKCARNVIAKKSIEYIQYREYAGRQWLCSPTEAVIGCISTIQDICHTSIKESLEKNNIKELLKTLILKFVEFDFLDCQEHKVNLISYLINLTTRFFLFNYCKDLNKILNGRKECDDDEDKFKIKAKKYYKKCYKRPLG